MRGKRSFECQDYHLQIRWMRWVGKEMITHNVQCVRVSAIVCIIRWYVKNNGRKRITDLMVNFNTILLLLVFLFSFVSFTCETGRRFLRMAHRTTQTYEYVTLL